MDGVAGCFERPLHINDGGFLTTVSACIFPTAKRNNLQLHPAQKERMISWVMESTSQRKSGSVSASCVRASSSRSLCAAVFGAIDVRSMGRGSSRHLLRGSRVGSPNTSFNLTLSLWKDNNFTRISGVCPNNFPFGWNTHLCDFQLFSPGQGQPYPAGAAFRCIAVDRHAAGRNLYTPP